MGNMQPEKISLMLLDTMRYDCINFSSDKKYLDNETSSLLDTPTLDSLCKDSSVFTKCYSTSSTTAQVIAGIFTGTKQINHGILNNHYSPREMLNENASTLAEILRKLGYLTVYSGDPAKNIKARKISRGFDFEFTLNDQALFDFLEEQKDEKIFLYSHFNDVHGPYMYSNVPPTENYNDDFYETMNSFFNKYNLPIPDTPFKYWNELFAVNGTREFWLPLYVRGVSKFDKGRFKIYINKLKQCNFLEPESLFIVTSDHGEGKHTHNVNKFQHGADAFEESVRVPLIVKSPNEKPGIYDDLVSNIDIFKIIIDHCITNPSERFFKQKLYSVNPFTTKRDYVWFEITLVPFQKHSTNYCVHARTIITQNSKYTLRGKPESFLDPRIFDLPDEDFIERLFLDLFARRPSDEELADYESKLNTMKQSNPKLGLYEYALQSEKYPKIKKSQILDLVNDPYEEHPIDPFSNNLSEEYLSYLPILLDLEKPDIELKRQTDNIENETELEQELKDELKKLGYL